MRLSFSFTEFANLLKQPCLDLIWVNNYIVKNNSSVDLVVNLNSLPNAPSALKIAAFMMPKPIINFRLQVENNNKIVLLVKPLLNGVLRTTALQHIQTKVSEIIETVGADFADIKNFLWQKADLDMVYLELEINSFTSSILDLFIKSYISKNKQKEATVLFHILKQVSDSHSVSLSADENNINIDLELALEN